MASENPDVSNQGTAGKRKHVTLMVPQKLEISRSLECGEDHGRLWLHTTLGHEIFMI